MKEEIVLKEAWVARDSHFGGNLKLWTVKPERSTKVDVWNGFIGDSILLDKNASPELTWEDEPIKVSVKIVQGDKTDGIGV